MSNHGGTDGPEGDRQPDQDGDGLPPREENVNYRITSFEPAPRGPVAPHAGTVGDRATLQALAKSGGGWVNKDGRVLTRGTLDGDRALLKFGETAPIVQAHVRAVAEREELRSRSYDEAWAEHRASGRPKGSFHFSHGSFDVSVPEPELDDMLLAEGWAPVELRRADGLKVMASTCDPVEFDRFRDVFVELADTLGCRLWSGTVRDAEPEVMYDPAYVAPESRQPTYHEFGHDDWEGGNQEPSIPTWWNGDGYEEFGHLGFAPGT